MPFLRNGHADFPEFAPMAFRKIYPATVETAEIKTRIIFSIKPPFVITIFPR